MKRLIGLLMSITMLFCITPIVSATINPANSSSVVYGATQLSAPKVRVTSTTNKVTISWNKVKNAKKYYIYRSTSKNGSYTKIATTTNTKYTDKKAKLNKGYYYKIKAGGNGNYKTSKYSVAKYVKPKFKGSISLEWLDYNFDDTTLVIGDTATLEITMSSIKPTDELTAYYDDDYVDVEWIETDDPDIWKLEVTVLKAQDDYEYTDETIDIGFTGYKQYYVVSADFSIAALKDNFPTYNVREDVIDIGQYYGINPSIDDSFVTDDNMIFVSKSYHKYDFIGTGYTVKDAETLLKDYVYLFGWEYVEKDYIRLDSGALAVVTTYINPIDNTFLNVCVESEYEYIVVQFYVKK